MRLKRSTLIILIIMLIQAMTPLCSLARVYTGLEVFLARHTDLVKGKRVGLLTNQTGVNGRKIASNGVRVSKFVTYHGMAINIRNDLSIFDLITPCGLDGVEMTSVLEETGKRHSMSTIKRNLAELLKEHFAWGEN